MHAQAHTQNPFLVRSVPITRPFIWLARGWEDLCSHPAASLAYGAIVAAIGVAVLGLTHHPYFIAAATSGFLLVGPIMTAGICELSRRRDMGEAANFDNSLRALRHNRAALQGFAQRLLFLSVLWFLASSAILYISMGSTGPTVTETAWGEMLQRTSLDHMLAYLAVGGILSAVVFAISVVSIPMILDLNADCSTAMKTSLQVTWRDFPAMMVWACLIVALVALGFASWMLGMVVIFPLLGHATWHAYRDLVH
jgi:uncharacterized membrane protein